MNFEIYKDKAGEFRWRLVSDNGEILADSGEGYKRKIDCFNQVARIMANARHALIEQKTDVGV